MMQWRLETGILQLAGQSHPELESSFQPAQLGIENYLIHPAAREC